MVDDVQVQIPVVPRTDSADEAKRTEETRKQDSKNTLEEQIENLLANPDIKGAKRDALIAALTGLSGDFSANVDGISATVNDVADTVIDGVPDEQIEFLENYEAMQDVELDEAEHEHIKTMCEDVNDENLNSFSVALVGTDLPRDIRADAVGDTMALLKGPMMTATVAEYNHASTAMKEVVNRNHEYATKQLHTLEANVSDPEFKSDLGKASFIGATANADTQKTLDDVSKGKISHEAAKAQVHEQNAHQIEQLVPQVDAVIHTLPTSVQESAKTFGDSKHILEAAAATYEKIKQAKAKGEVYHPSAEENAAMRVAIAAVSKETFEVLAKGANAADLGLSQGTEVERIDRAQAVIDKSPAFADFSQVARHKFAMDAIVALDTAKVSATDYGKLGTTQQVKLDTTVANEVYGSYSEKMAAAQGANLGLNKFQQQSIAEIQKACAAQGVTVDSKEDACKVPDGQNVTNVKQPAAATKDSIAHA